MVADIYFIASGQTIICSNKPKIAPIIAPVVTSLMVCLFKYTLDQAIRNTNKKKRVAMYMLKGNTKKDKKTLKETCSELFI
jgi:hypothetical protein